jgi:hypothetical protein
MFRGCGSRYSAVLLKQSAIVKTQIWRVGKTSSPGLKLRDWLVARSAG